MSKNYNWNSQWHFFLSTKRIHAIRMIKDWRYALFFYASSSFFSLSCPLTVDATIYALKERTTVNTLTGNSTYCIRYSPTSLLFSSLSLCSRPWDHMRYNRQIVYFYIKKKVLTKNFEGMKAKLSNL